MGRPCEGNVWCNPEDYPQEQNQDLSTEWVHLFAILQSGMTECRWLIVVRLRLEVTGNGENAVALAVRLRFQLLIFGQQVGVFLFQ